MSGPITRRARTIKDIAGPSIDTIQAGTELLVFDNPEGSSQAYFITASPDFGVTHVWKDEIEFLQPAVRPRPPYRFHPGDSVKVARLGARFEYRFMRFSRYGYEADDRHGFYGYLRKWSEDKQAFYYDSEETFWTDPIPA